MRIFNAAADRSESRRRPFGQPIHAGVASRPERKHTLSETIQSIYPQVDSLFVFLNDYTEIPDFLNRKKIVVLDSRDVGNMGDAGKFFGLTLVNSGIYLSLNDDLIYPANYAQKMFETLSRCEFKPVIGVHGFFYPTGASSFLGCKVRHHSRFLRPVSLLGTGSLAFSAEHLELDFADSAIGNKVDIFFGRLLKDRGIPALAVPCAKMWLKGAQSSTQSTLARQTPRLDFDATGNQREFSRLIVEGRPWGIGDLKARTAILGDSIMPDWGMFVDFFDTVVDRGASAAVESILRAPNTELMFEFLPDFVSFYCDSVQQLEICRAFVEGGVRHRVIEGILKECGRFDPSATAPVLAQAAELDRTNNGDSSSCVRSAVQAVRCYRRAGRLADAANLMSGLPENGATIDEYLRLELDRREFQHLYQTLDQHGLFDSSNSEHNYLTAVAMAHVEGLDRAIPWLCKLLIQEEIKFINDFSIHVQNLGLSLNASSKAELQNVEPALSVKASYALIKLYISLNERCAAAQLFWRIHTPIGKSSLEHTVLEAACQSELWRAIQTLNTHFIAKKLVPLALSPLFSKKAVLGALGAEAESSESAELVTVIVTVYNSAKTIRYSLDSILKQSHQMLQLVIVDDCSTDQTLEIVEKLASDDSRIVLIRNKLNIGPYGSRNAGLKIAAGKYITLQDADDYSHPQRIERQLSGLTSSDYVACYAKHIRMTGDGAIALENNGELVGDGHVTLMFKRDVLSELGGFIPVRTRGDVEFRARMVTYYGAHRTLVLDEVLLLALHSIDSNSWVNILDQRKHREFINFKHSYRRRHLLAGGNRERLFVPICGVVADNAFD